MSHLFNFGISQEDERTESAALGLPGGRVLSIASAGDMPLSLLALGAEEVVAVDSDTNQLHLLALKQAAATKLDRRDAVAFLGYRPAPAAARRRWLRELAEYLPASSRSFWEAHGEFATRGAIWAGRYERYLRGIQAVLRPLFARSLEALIACDTIEEQRSVFAARLGGRLLHGVFRICFHPAVFSSRGMDTRSLRYRGRGQSLGDQYFEGFRAMCTETLARDNYFLQLHVLGQVVDAAVIPTYLAPAGQAVLAARADRLRSAHDDIRHFLEHSAPGYFEKVHLSNIPDWLSRPEFETVLQALVKAAAEDARVVWRYLHVNRPVPPALRDIVRVDAALGARLQASDRFPFYAVVPAEICQPVAARADG